MVVIERLSGTVERLTLSGQTLATLEHHRSQWTVYRGLFVSRTFPSRKAALAYLWDTLEPDRALSRVRA